MQKKYLNVVHNIQFLNYGLIQRGYGARDDAALVAIVDLIALCKEQRMKFRNGVASAKHVDENIDKNALTADK